jgi:CheY-like chemotaxis protein
MAEKRISILIVEDEPVTREITTRYLEQAGFTVRSAETGEEALTILRQEGPAIDWLLTDINLPGCIDGWIVGAEFHLSYPLRPVVYASAFAPRRQAHPAGGVYVPKPYSPAMIVDLFRRLAAEETAPPADLRMSPRMRSMMGARIVFDRQFAAMDCVVRDISATGARLVLAADDVIPDEFELQIPQRGRCTRARLVWRKATTCGVKFVDSRGEPTRLAS